MKKYFDILGLPEGASQDAIQDAYDILSKELDPVINNNQEFFVEEYEKLQEAYKVLSNSTILKSSEKSYINSNVEETPQVEQKKINNDSITITISPEKIEELKNKSTDLKEINTYKEASQGWIIAGFVFAFLGGWGGIYLGAKYAFGNYKKDTKVIGWVMLILGVISMGIWKSSH
jgi:curved DNA-binding protein CbpA